MNLITQLIEIGEPKIYKKNEYLIREGQIEQYVYFIQTGAVRAFLLTEFEELTIRFGYKDSMITALTSFLTGASSDIYIQAIRQSEVLKISRQKFQTLLAEYPDYQLQYNHWLEQTLLQQMEREVDLLTASPTERLKRVLARSPNLFQEIPFKYIASYLRMTPETLSRIRKI